MTNDTFADAVSAYAESREQLIERLIELSAQITIRESRTGGIMTNFGRFDDLVGLLSNAAVPPLPPRNLHDVIRARVEELVAEGI
jgi:hypothetical protein